MIYKQFKGKKISALGLGMMRLPTVGGDDSRVDEKTTAEMIEFALRSGINYFDTAWGYHSGNSEIVAGKILSKYPRDSYCLASKFPGYSLANMGKTEEIFERQLEKCRTDAFDFYLFHNVCESNIDAYLDRSYRTYEYLSEQKRKGRIKHLGFSAHGEIPIIERFLDAYGDGMEFGQLQLNWLDWNFQNARGKAALLDSRGIPVWVMEPVRGGRLANLPEKYVAKLKALRPNETVPGWAFRFIQTQKDVLVTLSGMSDMAQLKANIKTFETEEPLDENELNALFEIAAEMTGTKTLPCTGCKYCVSHCPKGLDIPELIRLYNEHNFSDGGFIAPMVLGTFSDDKLPSVCIGCKSCEAVCPQRIKISLMMKDFAQKAAPDRS